MAVNTTGTGVTVGLDVERLARALEFHYRPAEGRIEIDFEAIPDEHNAALVERLERSGGVFWPAVPRVGDIISFEDGMTAVVKAVFWDFTSGAVMVRIR